MSANQPKTGREAVLLDDIGRDHIPALARRCVDQAMGELGIKETNGATLELAYRAAIIGMRHAAEAVTGAQRVAEYATRMSPPTPA